MSRIRFEPKTSTPSSAAETPPREKQAKEQPVAVTPAVQGDAETEGFALTPEEGAPKPAKKPRGKKSG